MFREIFAFEFRYQLRNPVFLIATAIFAILAFGAVTSDTVQIGGAVGNINRNAPFVIMQFLLILSFFNIFTTTAFVAGSILRDHEYGTHEIFFSTPMRKRDFLFGRYLGSFLVAFLVFIGVALAILLGTFMPWLDPERIGPFMLSPYLFAIAALILPNLFLSGAIFFSIATLTRSMLYTYVGVVVFYVGYLVSINFLANIESEFVAGLVDPFGFAAFQIETKYWTIAERNTSVLPLQGALLYNRLLWTGVALAFLALAYSRFRFTVGGSRRRRRKTAAAVAMEQSQPAVSSSRPRLPSPIRISGSSWSRFLHQMRLEVFGTLRSLPFLIILLIGVGNVTLVILNSGTFYGTSPYPVTGFLLQAIEGGFLLFMVILLTFYSGELVWRERGHKLSEVFDALPVSNSVYWGAKLVGLLFVVLIMLGAAMFTGVCVQLFKGFPDLELLLFFRGLFLAIGYPFLLIAVLALFAQVLANHKYVGFLVMVLFYISFPVLSSLDFNHNLYQFAGAPDAVHSDMNGYGHFVTPLFWFYLYWTLCAAILVALIHLFWVRGTETSWRWRWTLARRNLTTPARFGLAGTMTAFVLVGGFIFYNTNIINEYLPGNVVEDRQAEFEKKYKQYEGIPQPKITAVYADVDIFPEERNLDIRGRYTLVNRSAEPIDTLHLTLNNILIINRIDLPGSRLEMGDPVLGYYIYRMEDPIDPGEELELGFDLAFRTEGFVNNGSNTNVVHNGTFINSFAYFPHLGYTRYNEIQDPSIRRKHDLPPIQRFAKVDDEEARRFNFLSQEADWVDFETVVSTSPDQIAIAPGYLQREWIEAGRRYFHYKMDAPILNFVAYLSARYEVRRDRWNDVTIEIYHHPTHTYNVDRMIHAVKRGLEYFTENFGPYQHRQVRIIEFPRYDTFAQSFPNTFPWSEQLGFIADLNDDDEESIDYVFYVAAHELAHQWWAHQVVSGNVQGATFLVESMAQYSALMIMEKEYGRENMRKFLKYELDIYLRGRGGELIEELPLILVENQNYIHYRKGSLIMYALRDYLGEEVLNNAIARFVRDVKFQQPPYTNSLEFLSYVRDAAPDGFDGTLEDLFHTITLYDNRAKTATYRAREDGKYLVKVAVETRKFRADGQGVETEIPIDDWIDVAVFGEEGEGSPPEGKLLALERVRIDPSTTEIELVVDEEPRRAGIDPFNKLVDRNPEDNLKRITPAS